MRALGVLGGVVLVAGLCTADAAATENTPTDRVVVVAHPEVEISTISRSELSKIFLGRLRTWSEGERVFPVDQSPDRPVRRDFTRWIHDRGVVNIDVYWKRMIFSGRGVPPPELSDDQEVLEYVRATPGAVGYVNPSESLEDVQEVQVTD